MKRWLKEPLLHFLVIGALLFGVYAWMNRGGNSKNGQIVITQGQVDTLRVTFSRLWQRPPTPSELNGLIQDSIREEVLAREARALGLDRDDLVIRRRLRQKMEFISNDLSEPPEPTDAQLEEFLTTHSDLFRVEPRLTVRQVYLDPGRRGDALQRDAPRLLTELNRPGAAVNFRTLGDATMLPAELVDVPASELVRDFGEDYTKKVETLPTGRWAGPVASGYGDHLVFVAQRTPARIPALTEIRDRVAREWTDARRREENEQLYQKLLKQYEVVVEGSARPVVVSVQADAGSEIRDTR